VIERIAWILDDSGVPRGIGVRAQSKEHFACVVHIAIFVHGYDIFAEHHLAHAPQTVHHLESLVRILFPNTDEDQIVKYTFGRQRHVHDFRKIHFENWQQNTHARVPDVIIFHGRDADDCCWINRVTPMGNRRQMEHGVILDGSVITGVVTERSFRAQLAGLDISLKNKVDVCWHIEIDRLAANQLD
jgi:hypothetical protein